MKLKYIIAGAVAFVMLAGIATSIAISVVNMNYMREFNAKIEEEQEKANAPDDPEYVTIGDIYEIKSSKNVSDAYISGDSSALTDEEKATLEKASAVIEEVVKDDMTLYEKERALYEWVTKNISNEYEGMGLNPQALADPGSVLETKTAVCVGFATTYKLLVNMIGIDCIIEHDVEKSHSWDLLKLDDGCWYICDCYMGVSSRWANFNMNQEYALANHTFDASLYPVANGMKYFPAFSERKDIFKPEDIIKIAAEFLESKEDYMSVAVKKTDISKSQLDYLLTGISTRIDTEKFYLEYNVANVKIENSEYTLAVLSKSIFNEAEKELGEEMIERYDRLLTHQFGEEGGGDDEDTEDLDQDIDLSDDEPMG